MPKDSYPPAIFLMGPTASGKTALAMRLHEALPVEIISVDASQVYRGLDIGTAKPSEAELARAPHRLIDIRDPAEPYSAADFCADALKEMADISRSGRIPLLVGGTMFYFHALEQGLSALPAANPAIRERLSREAAERGWPALHARLRAADTVTAARIDPHDAQRIQRALEVLALTGEAPSRLMQATTRATLPYRLIKLAIVPKERTALHAKIAERFHAMLAAGLVDEVKSLMERKDLNLQLPSMRTVGYRQVGLYLTEQLSHSQMVERAIIATRQLAKRQFTWLRGYPGLCRFDSGEPAVDRRLLAYLSGTLGTVEV